jgi:AbiV family abortive infection protein
MCHMQFGRIELKPAYNAHLTAAEIADGINLARINSARLYNDARLLLDNKRYSSAAALAILSIEESGKELVLRQLATVPPTAPTKGVWNSFRNHLQKNIAWILPLVAASEKNVSVERAHGKVFDRESDHAALLDRLKQACLYTDCVGRGEWQTPEMMDEQHASFLVKLADSMQTASAEVTEEQILEMQQIVRDGVTREKMREFVSKYGHEEIPLFEND